MVTCIQRHTLGDGRHQCTSNRILMNDPARIVSDELCTVCPYQNKPNREVSDIKVPHAMFMVPRLRKDCQYIGEPTGKTIEKPCCKGVARNIEEMFRGVTTSPLVPLITCTHPTYGPETTYQRCMTCPGYESSSSKFTSLPTDPITGIVIGSFHWPLLIALQIVLVRDLCGSVPILVSDDCSTGWQAEGRPPIPKSRYDLLCAVCAAFPDVTLSTNEGRAGHLWGDTLAFRNGITWAKERGIKVLAKLSQRYLILKPRWLQDYGRRMLDEGKAIASQKCRHKNIRFAVRTEACLLDVDKWHTPEILHLLSPESGQIGGEPTIGHIVNNIFGGEMYRWPIMTPERHYQCKGDVLWHHQNDNKKCEEQYRALAAKYGITLDDDFQCGRPAGS